MLSTLEELQTLDATQTIEPTPVGLNPSTALSGIEQGLIDPVSQASLFRASANSGVEEESLVPYSSSSSWWTGKAYEGLSYEEVKILNDIASYRAQKGLDMPPLSKSLTAVAKIHAEDLSRNNPDRGSCNLHSWSNKGFWTPVCYIVKEDGSHPYAHLMWSKPKEITQKLFAQTYTGYGYEIASTGGANAVEGWKKSKHHRPWLEYKGNSIGVGVSNGYAVVWFGVESDPNDPGSNLNTADNLGTVSGTRTLSDWVGKTDTNDVYRLNVSKISNLTITIDGVTASSPNLENLKNSVKLIRDINNNGRFDPGEEVKARWSDGLAYRNYWSMSYYQYPVAPSSNYFVRVASNVDTPYNLKLYVKDFDVTKATVNIDFESTVSKKGTNEKTKDLIVKKPELMRNLKI